MQTAFFRRGFAVLAACAALLGQAVPIRAQTASFESRFADLIAKAKAEGELTWYQGFLEAPGKDFSAHFQQRFGIKVNHQFLNSGPIYERFRTESASGRNIADVFSISDTGPMIEAIKNGYIAKYDTQAKDKHPKGWVLDSPNGTAYPTQRVQMAVAYNTQLVKPEDAAALETWKGLLDPKFGDGVLGLSDPSRTLSAFPTYYYFMRINKADYGEGFLKQLAVQKPIIYASQTEESARLGAGEISVGVMVDIVAIQQYNLGAPVAFYYPSPTPVVLQYSGISSKAPHPNAARLFLEYITSDEGLAEWKKFSGGGTGRPDIDEKVKTKYSVEPWYKAPTDYFLITDWDAANKEYKGVLSEWSPFFNRK